MMSTTTNDDVFNIAHTARDANAAILGDIVARAIALADAAVIADIEDLPSADWAHRDGYVWRDTRPCLDEREHSPPVIDMWRQALTYAEARLLIVRHPVQPALVRVAHRSAGART